MIYTVTLNPSIDYIVRLDQVQVGSVNRMDSDDKFAGGKGINVSRVLKRLDIPNTATGFIGGFTGKFITDTLAEEEIETRFVQVTEDTRINVKIKADQETEINGTGPNVEPAQLEELKAVLASLTAEDTVVFAGSSAKNLGNVIYKDLIALTRKTGAQVVCDFEGQTLIDSLDYQPLLVKPNNHELGAIFGVKLESLDEIEKYNLEVIPLTINIDGEEYDYRTIGNEEYIIRMRTAKEFSTSQPAIGKYIEAFEKWTKEGYKILVLTISSALSFASAIIRSVNALVFLADSISLSKASAIPAVLQSFSKSEVATTCLSPIRAFV